MLQLFKRKQFRKDIKRLLCSSEFNISNLERIVLQLVREEKLEDKYLNHRLEGKLSGCFECHIQPDVLLIYTIDKKEKMLYLVRIGSHSQLF